MHLRLNAGYPGRISRALILVRVEMTQVEGLHYNHVYGRTVHARAVRRAGEVGMYRVSRFDLIKRSGIVPPIGRGEFLAG